MSNEARFLGDLRERTLFGGVYDGRRVFITGHTGFKGSWLALWLHTLGARVAGYALAPPTDPSLFAALDLSSRIDHIIGDVRDQAHLTRVLQAARPEIVFHLAAQPLVRFSYQEPRLTYETNVMGTVNLLEAVRATPGIKAVVVVTSDKCYENKQWDYAYRENDPLGGADPYSSSKACAELVAAMYRASFFTGQDVARLATARAGNVIGGGDWALDRIVPDCVRSLSAGRPVMVRNPGAVRPWQYVLEPLAGYLWLGSKLLGGDGGEVADAWNFGPGPRSNITVAAMVEEFIRAWGAGAWNRAKASAQPHEAKLLRLDCTKTASLLNWHPVYEVERAIAKTAAWYLEYYGGKAMYDYSLMEIASYVEAAAAQGAVWAEPEKDRVVGAKTLLEER